MTAVRGAIFSAQAHDPGAERLLASRSGNDALAALGAEPDSGRLPDVCENGDCSHEGEPCWETSRGRVCRDASVCRDSSCSAPRYVPPVLSRHRAQLNLPQGYTLRDAWLVVDDASSARTERALLRDLRCETGVVCDTSAPGVARLEFDLGLFRVGLNRFEVRGRAEREGLVVPVHSESEPIDYQVPPALGHVGKGTFRLPLLHFPRTVTGCKPGLCKDRDGDGLNDLWENVAAAQLRPRLMMDGDDGLFASQSDSVRVLTSVVPLKRHGEHYVLFANVIAFSRDYGFMGFLGHPGDTESAGMLFRVDSHETLHWVASAAKGHPCLLCRPSFRFGEQQFAADGAPLLFVERDKHGIWLSAHSCREEAGFRCGDRPLRPEAVNIGDAGRRGAQRVIDSLDGLEPDGPFGALAGVFPGDAIWSNQRARIPGRFCGGQRFCSGDQSATQAGAIMARLVKLFQNSSW